MATDVIHMALFKEDKIDNAADAIHQLRQMGIRDKDISVLSGVPYSERILGRPMSWTRVPLIALMGAAAGFMIALALQVISAIQYPLIVGGMRPFQIQTSIVVFFELTMLGLLISTFLGVFVETISPSFGPKGYHPNVSDGEIGILFSISPKQDDSIHTALRELGAEIVHPDEVMQS
jgi:hypothetical protein